MGTGQNRFGFFLHLIRLLRHHNAMPVKNPNRIGVRWVTRHEANEMLEARARRVLNIGAKEFISRWRSGKYRNMDADTCPGVIELALLAPLPKIKRGRKKS